MSSVLRATAALVACCSLATGTARAAMDGVPLPGGAAGLARALQVSSAPEPARLVPTMARVIHRFDPSRNQDAQVFLERLTTHYATLEEFERLLAEAQAPQGSIALASAADRNLRGRLENLLEFVDLRLRERNRRHSVEPRNNRDAAARVASLANLGIDLSKLADRLNAGEAVAIAVPSESVPVPLTPALWGIIAFGRTLDAADLIPSILADRNAALLAHGLASIDTETRQYLATQPELLQHLYESRAGIVATMAGRLVVANGRVVPPGGEAAVALWEDVVDEPVTRPDRFVRQLFGRADGRLAYLYDTIGHLDPAHQAFALGTWIGDARVRQARFRALRDAVVASEAAWNIVLAPFSRTPYDAATVLSAVAVNDNGSPKRPAAARFWDRAFESGDLPQNPERQLRDLDEDGQIDAAWLVERIAAVEATVRPKRYIQLQYGQRLFGEVEAAGLPDAFVAVRGAVRAPMLLLSLERMGVRSPAIHAAAARRAGALTAINGLRAFNAHARFQGALAVLARLALVGTVPANRIEGLAASLIALPHEQEIEDGSPFAGWLDAELLPAIGGPPAAREDALLTALAGASPSGEAARVIEWEGARYRVDLAAAELRRLRAVRQKQDGIALETALALHHVAVRLSRETVTLDAIASAAGELKTLAPQFAPQRRAENEPPPGVDAPRNGAETIASAARDLSRITRPRDTRNAAREAEALFAIVDRALADVMTTLAYALVAGPADSPTALSAAVSVRHDFGLALADGDRAGAPWIEPQQVAEAGVPWHVSGSLLALDVSLAELSLRRVSADMIAAPRVDDNVRRTFTRSFGLANPRWFADADQIAIALSIAKGRARISALAKAADPAAAMAAVAQDIRLDGWRRSAVEWALEHDAARTTSYFSMREFAALGGLGALPGADAWGMADATGACLCTRIEEVNAAQFVFGRPQLGLLPTAISDVNLRIAEALHALRLPAVLAKPVLSAALAEYLDGVAPIDSDDWLTFVRAAQAISQEKIEDYVATLTADGPLVAADR